jgi:hypothetical protein
MNESMTESPKLFLVPKTSEIERVTEASVPLDPLLASPPLLLDTLPPLDPLPLLEPPLEEPLLDPLLLGPPLLDPEPLPDALPLELLVLESGATYTPVPVPPQLSATPPMMLATGTAIDVASNIRFMNSSDSS